MGWTETARREHDRSRLRYTSDCTDAEWAIIAPLLARTTKVGRPRLHRARDLWNAIQYLAATGCQWAQLPRDFRSEEHTSELQSLMRISYAAFSLQKKKKQIK